MTQIEVFAGAANEIDQAAQLATSRKQDWLEEHAHVTVLYVKNGLLYRGGPFIVHSVLLYDDGKEIGDGYVDAPIEDLYPLTMPSNFDDLIDDEGNVTDV